MRWSRRRLEGQEVIVNMMSGTAFAGTVAADRAGWMTLRSASLLQTGAAPRPLDGEVILDRTAVDFVQRA